MIEIPGIEIVNRIYDGSSSVVYRAVQTADKLPIILKMLKHDYPSSNEIVRYNQELEITRNLSSAQGVIKVHNLMKYRNTLILVVEDFGAHSLKILSGLVSFTLIDILKIAIRISEILGNIHASDVIHKDINPSNIVYNTTTDQLKIIDFGISTQLSYEKPLAKSPALIEGTLGYISPEQTGRINRNLDYRTDYYSFGVSLYEMLAQVLPFRTSDPLELMHCHIAKKPINPKELNRTIPEELSRIILKLMEKNPEDRYQSSVGIRKDLEFCLYQFQGNETNRNFLPGRYDVPEKLTLPAKLYGRDNEFEELIQAFIRTRQGKSEIFLIKGMPGVGKTALVDKMFESVADKGGFFITGKFDQIKPRIPYAAVTEAFRQLVRRILSESETSLYHWKQKLASALGPNGQLVLNLIPELEKIIGSQPAVTDLGPLEAQTRFNKVFRDFVYAVCDSQHPLVLFLDDLQWADYPSLKLIELMLGENGVDHLLIVGAYRENEIHSTHVLIPILSAAREQGVPVNTLSLSPLDVEDVQALLADVFHQTWDDVTEAASLIHLKTDGNPFFIGEFLKHLYSEKLLEFNAAYGHWSWDLEKIRACYATRNVAEILSEKVLDLSDSTKHVLKYAASLGNTFDLDLLSLILELTPQETLRHLWESIEKGFVNPLDDTWKSVFLGIEQSGTTTVSQFIFCHDRLQQAAYSIIPVEERANTHYFIGMSLLKKLPEAKREDALLFITEQLNTASENIQPGSEQAMLAELNLAAGRKARGAGAYEAALNYFSKGMEFLTQDFLDDDSRTGLDLFMGGAEAALLCSRFNETDRLASFVIKNAPGKIDKAKAYGTLIQAAFAQNNPLQAVEFALKAWELLGIKVDRKPTRLKALMRLIKSRFQLVGKMSSDRILANGKRNRNDFNEAAKIYAGVGTSVYWTSPEFFVTLTCQALSIALKSSDSGSFGFILSAFAILVCHLLGEVDLAYKCGELACELTSNPGNEEFRGRTKYVVSSLINYRKKHVRECSLSMMEAYHWALESGDREYAALSLCGHSIAAYHAGDDLLGLEHKTQEYFRAIRQTKHQIYIDLLAMQRQAILNLIGRSQYRCRLKGDSYDEEDALNTYREIDSQTSIFSLCTNKLILCYLFRDYDEGKNMIDQGEMCADLATASMLLPVFRFFEALTLLALCKKQEPSVQRSFMKRVKRISNLMKKYARYAPMNYLHKYHHIEAERLRVSGETPKTMYHYREAIRLADRYDYMSEKAMALESAGNYLADQGDVCSARGYLLEARYWYHRWGAGAKVTDLDEQYPHLVQIPGILSQASMDISKTDTGTIGSRNNMDLIAVARSLQAISEEREVRRLLDRIMDVVTTAGGAQRSLLILIRSGKLSIQATYSLFPNDIIVDEPGIPVDGCPWLATSIVSYVSRTGETITLNDAVKEGPFTNDPYIVKNRPKSILCLPLARQGLTTGVLYMENNASEGVFTRERTDMLHLLSAQAAISIENAYLYEQMESVVLSRTAELQRSNSRLSEQIQEKERAVQALLEAKMQAESSNLAKDQFLANVSHELRTPLNAIIGFSDLLKGKFVGPLNEEQSNFTSGILDSGRHLLKLINDILDLAKVASGKMELEPSICRLGDLLATSLVFVRETAAKQHVDLLNSTSADMHDLRIHADETKLLQVLINLLANAVKFTPAGGRVELIGTVDENRLVVRITDTGIGLRVDDIKRIFEPFEQVDSSITRKHKGTGLGLSLARKLVELHGGTIRAVSDGLGKGSTFEFQIPMVLKSVRHNELESLLDQRKPLSREANTIQAIGTWAGTRVLVVEDDTAGMELITKILELGGCSVIQAGTAEEALKIVLEMPPDLIIMDVSLPGLNGLTAARMLKQDSAFSAIPIIILTAHAMEYDEAEASKAGCEAYLTKPIDLEQFRRVINTFLLKTAAKYDQAP